MRDCTNENVCKEIISEYDTDMDGALNYQEFLNLFLPATDERLRKLCLLKSEI
jgi:Ca2+-binding EF-hand superfamily protein